jgi:uncharacterized damage-inducible protein DinB
MKEQQDKLRYPIGHFEYGKPYTLDDTRKHIKILSKFPKDLKNALKKLKSGELEKTYRPEGWTVRQVVNHLADSHLNAYVRVKLAVTENTPIIKPYEEQLWAELEDGKHGSVKTSVKLITALHKRWANFLKSLQEDDLEKGYYHPASKRTVLLQEAIALYVWHSQHHLAHIYLVIDAKSKNTAGKKAEEEAKADTDSKPKSVAPVQAPKKRTITAEHREKIRAAQVARHSKSTTSETEVKAAAPAPKRGRKPGVKVAAAPVASAEAPKRGRKPGVKAAAAVPVSSAEAPKRGRKPGVKAAATAPVASAEAPKRGRKPGVKAAAAAPVASAEAPKRGRKPGIKATQATVEAPAKRKRRTKAEMQADAGAVATNGVPATAPAAKTAKAKKAAPAAGTDAAPKRRGLSAERMAEIRALRGVKKAAETPAEPAQTAKPAKVAKAAKAAKAPAAENGAAPKRRGLSPERMAEIRALRGIKKAAEPDETAPAKTATAKAAKPKAAKAAKTAAPVDGAAPKRRGLSAERMAEIRAMKGNKKKE